jgi:serine/threonine-protein kinase PknG
MKCTYCPGTVEDGYCDQCGMAPPAGQPAPVSARTASQSILSSRTAPSARSGRTGSASAARRGMLGAGLVEVPPVPYRDPSTAVMPDPQVDERKRFCSNCFEPVGRGRGGSPGRTEGFCAKCRTAFSFTPKLVAGDLVGGQYEVLGCLAHGGLGWVYLARDRNVSDRWVVLKGLLDTGDAEALAAAAAERAFLAEVEHPNIVKIYNFVQHSGSGYIVMEYVGGQDLKHILAAHREHNGAESSLPLPQAIAYALEVLRAFGYLHGLGLLYCDFKPDNAIQDQEQLKLLDLGGVRRIDDQVSAIYGTVGYQAPEIAQDGPSVSSDLYTVGRTLAVLSFPFKGFMTTFANRLPDRADVPLLTRYESYDRLLRRTCHADPAERFQDAAELAEQLTGVLREVLAEGDGRSRPAASTLFGPERNTAGADLPDAGLGGPPLGSLDPRAAAAALPVPLVHGSDPAAGFLAGLTIREPDALAAALESAPVSSPEVGFMLVRVRIELGRFDAARTLLDELETTQAGDWRVDWYRALAALAAGDAGTAQRLFDGLYSWMPGEAATKLGLAFAAEPAGARDLAAQLYETVWRTDTGHVSAAFGLARVRLAAGDRTGAVAVLDSVPEISSRHIAAQVAAVAAAVRGRDPGDLTGAELAAVGHRLTGLRLDPGRHGRLEAEVLETALSWAQAVPSQPAGTLFGAPLSETGLRRRLEQTYRELARLARPGDDRHTLVVTANAVRPRTVF